MHQISAADSRSELNAPTTRPGEVRYPRKISFGRNLYLLVMPKGGRHWRYCYRYGGKRKTLALGTYPDVPMVRTANILMSLVIDKLGLFGMEMHALSVGRMVGAALMVVGIALISYF
jgi:Putative inner membrane exporter, YdcZ